MRFILLGLITTFAILWVTEPQKLDTVSTESKAHILFKKIGERCEVTAIVYDPDVEEYYLTQEFFNVNECDPTRSDYTHGYKLFDGTILPFKRWLFSSNKNQTK